MPRRSSGSGISLCWRRMNKTRQARLLVIDVDGTLLTTDYQLTKATCSAVQQVSARGVQVVLASARSPRALHAIMGALGIMGLAICYSGALTCRISPDPHRPSEVVTEQRMNLSSTHMVPLAACVLVQPLAASIAACSCLAKLMRMRDIVGALS